MADQVHTDHQAQTYNNLVISQITPLVDMDRQSFGSVPFFRLIGGGNKE